MEKIKQFLQDEREYVSVHLLLGFELVLLIGIITFLVLKAL